MRACRPWEGTKGSRHREGGAAAVEFALIVPLLFLILFGTLQYGFYFFSLQAGNQAAREAARRAAVGDMPTCTAFVDYVKSRVGRANFGNTITVKRTYTNAAPNTLPATEVGDLVTVTVSYRSIDMNVPFIPTPGGTAQIETSADTRVERVEALPAVAPETCS
jgi:Flp pilus assembly protein TadG